MDHMVKHGEVIEATRTQDCRRSAIAMRREAFLQRQAQAKERIASFALSGLRGDAASPSSFGSPGDDATTDVSASDAQAALTSARRAEEREAAEEYHARIAARKREEFVLGRISRFRSATPQLQEAVKFERMCENAGVEAAGGGPSKAALYSGRHRGGGGDDDSDSQTSAGPRGGSDRDDDSATHSVAGGGSRRRARSVAGGGGGDDVDAMSAAGDSDTASVTSGVSHSGGKKAARRRTAAATHQHVLLSERRKTMMTLTPADYFAARSVFEAVDVDGSGYIELSELLAFRKAHPKKLSIEVFQNLMVNSDAKIYFDEFLAVHFPHLPAERLENIVDMYELRLFDTKNFTSALRTEVEERYHALHEYETQGDGAAKRAACIAELVQSIEKTAYGAYKARVDALNAKAGTELQRAAAAGLLTSSHGHGGGGGAKSYRRDSGDRGVGGDETPTRRRSCLRSPGAGPKRPSVSPRRISLLLDGAPLSDDGTSKMEGSTRSPLLPPSGNGSTAPTTLSASALRELSGGADDDAHDISPIGSRRGSESTAVGQGLGGVTPGTSPAASRRASRSVAFGGVDAFMGDPSGENILAASGSMKLLLSGTDDVDEDAAPGAGFSFRPGRRRSSGGGPTTSPRAAGSGILRRTSIQTGGGDDEPATAREALLKSLVALDERRMEAAVRVPRAFAYHPTYDPALDMAAAADAAAKKRARRGARALRRRTTERVPDGKITGSDLVPSEPSAVTLRTLRDRWRSRWHDVVAIAKLADLRGHPLVVDVRRLLLSSAADATGTVSAELRQALLEGTPPPATVGGKARSVVAGDGNRSVAGGGRASSVAGSRRGTRVGGAPSVRSASIAGSSAGGDTVQTPGATPSTTFITAALQRRSITFKEQGANDHRTDENVSVAGAQPAIGRPRRGSVAGRKSVTMAGMAPPAALEPRVSATLTVAGAQPSGQPKLLEAVAAASASAAIVEGAMHPYEALLPPLLPELHQNLNTASSSAAPATANQPEQLQEHLPDVPSTATVSPCNASMSFLDFVKAFVTVEERRRVSATIAAGQSVSALDDDEEAKARRLVVDGVVRLDGGVSPVISDMIPDAVLACVAVDFSTFVVVLGDYFIQHASNVTAERFDPRVRENIAELQWGTLFPQTGSVRSGFDRIAADLEKVRGKHAKTGAAAVGGRGGGVAAASVSPAATDPKTSKSISKPNTSASSTMTGAAPQAASSLAAPLKLSQRSSRREGMQVHISAARAVAGKAEEEDEIARLEAILDAHDRL